MTEAEWLACTDPKPMLDYLRGDPLPDDWNPRPPLGRRWLSWVRRAVIPVSKRKAALLACACCRRAWDLMRDNRTREGLECAERHADGLATRKELTKATSAVQQVRGIPPPPPLIALSDRCRRWFFCAHPGNEGIYCLVYHRFGGWEVCFRSAMGHMANAVAETAVVCAAADHPEGEFSGIADAVGAAAKRAELQQQCLLVRDIFGNPFRPVSFSPSWRTDTAVSLARQMYDARDFSAMPILADALQDAGCNDDDILNHCQGPGPHVRGCWVVDLVLNKKD